MSWDYRLARQALKNFRKFPKKEQVRIFDILEEMKVDPFGGDLKLYHPQLRFSCSFAKNLERADVKILKHIEIC